MLQFVDANVLFRYEQATLAFRKDERGVLDYQTREGTITQTREGLRVSKESTGPLKVADARSSMGGRAGTYI
jgi:hypothetical protein